MISHRIHVRRSLRTRRVSVNTPYLAELVSAFEHNQPPLLDNRRSIVLHRFTKTTYSILNYKTLACWQKITTNTSIHQKSSEYTASNRAKRHPDTEPTQMSTSISMESSQKSILKIRHVSTIQETHMTTISRIALSQNTHARKV